MPSEELREVALRGLQDVKVAAERFKVTPSALTVRAMHQRKFSAETALGYLRELEAEFRALPKPQPRQPKAVNAIRKYSGRALTTRMFRAVEERKLTEGEFCRVICLNRIRPFELSELREAVR